MAAEHGVNALFTAPTAIRAIKKEDPDGSYIGKYDLSGLKYLFQAGERLDPDTYHWAADKLGIPVVDHWWQTETGWAIAADPMGLEPMPIKPGSATVPMPGYDVQILRPDGTVCDTDEEGAICVKLPLPPGTLPTLWGDDQRYVASYLSAYDGYYLTGDGGYLDSDGYLFVMGRTDDVINVAGHRLSTGSIEAVLAEHPAVAECAVIGVADGSRDRCRAGSWCSNPARRPTSCPTSSSRRSGKTSAPWRFSNWSTSSRPCPRRGRARSCARPCAVSPTAATNPCRPPSRIRRCSGAQGCAAPLIGLSARSLPSGRNLAGQR